MAAVAYLRRSSDRNGGAESYETQRAAVLELAMRHGDAEPELIVEWGRSGADAGSTHRGGKRKAWPQLRQRIRDGEVAALYSYSLSRLARSTRGSDPSSHRCVQGSRHVAGSPSRLQSVDAFGHRRDVTVDSEVDPERLQGLTIADIVPADTELQQSEFYRELAQRNSATVGADDQTERLAIISFEDQTYALGFTLSCYPDGWKVRNLGAALAAGTDMMGFAVPHPPSE